MAEFARQHCSWVVGLEDIVLLTMDFNRRGQAAFEGQPIQSEFRKNPEAKVDFYIGEQVYDFKDDSDILEWCNIGEPLRETLASTTSQHFGTLEKKLRTSGLTRHLRVPLLYQIGGCTLGVLDNNLSGPGKREAMERFVNQVEQNAFEAGINSRLHPQLKKMEPRLQPIKRSTSPSANTTRNSVATSGPRTSLEASRTHKDYFGFTRR